MAVLKAPAEDQALLLDVQALDTRLAQLAARSAKLPEAAALASLVAERDALQRDVAERTGEWEDAQAELGRVESDVQVVEARIARDRERSQAGGSMKDVQALEQELTALAARHNDLEEIELAVMETVEQKENALAAARSALADLEARIAEATAARDAAAASIEQERAHTAANRQTVAAKVPADLLALYEKQRGRYGVGASFLQRGISTAAGAVLSPAELEKVRQAAPDDVLLCPESSAILVRTSESGL